ncbi:MAG: ribosome assembly RNA-binding protein YhbY [Deltaproteobacteria bacterium]|nr:ribosome assembly RNA-binding protein YhbY [Deltaproteobacteria bacterium]
MLNGKQRRYLRGLGHELKPIVQVGKGGVDDGLVAAVDQALSDHELIKLRIGENAKVDRHEAADAIAARTRSDVAQVLGNTVLLFRPDPDDPKITLPKAKVDSDDDAADETDSDADAADDPDLGAAELGEGSEGGEDDGRARAEVIKKA